MKAIILLCVALAGCASAPASPEYLKAKADCDAAAAPAAGMQVYVVYHDCMRARGYK